MYANAFRRSCDLRHPGHPWEGGSEHPLATWVLFPAQTLARWPSSVGWSLRTQPIARSRGPCQGAAPAAQRGRCALTRVAAEGDRAECEVAERPRCRASRPSSTPPPTSSEHAPYRTSNHTGECRKQVDMFRTAPAAGSTRRAMTSSTRSARMSARRTGWRRNAPPPASRHAVLTR